jgi:glutamate 5-kinase
MTRLQQDVQQLVERQHDAALFLDARDHTAAESERIAYALDARLVLHPEAAPKDVLAVQRQAALLRAITAQGGRWKTGRVIRLYQALGYGPVGKSRAAHDLRALHQARRLKRHDRKGVTYYTLHGEAQS